MIYTDEQVSAGDSDEDVEMRPLGCRALCFVQVQAYYPGQHGEVVELSAQRI